MNLINDLGGPLKRLEPKNCKELQNNGEVWDLLHGARMMPFSFAMKGYNRVLLS